MMKKIIVILLVNISMLLATTDLKYESLMSDFNGVSSNDYSIICYGNYGIILRSTDLCGTWEQIKIAPDSTSILKIRNINGNFWGITNTGNIINSSDNGKNWTASGTSHNLYDFQFYEDKIVALSDSRIIMFDDKINKTSEIKLNLKIIPTELELDGDYAILPADTGAIFLCNLKDNSDMLLINFKESGLCTKCKIPAYLQNSGSSVYLSAGDNILKSSVTPKKWKIAAKGGGLFRLNNDTIFNLQPNIYYAPYLLTTPNLTKFTDGNYVPITTEPVRRYVVSQSYKDFRFVNDSIIIAAGNNKTIYKSSDSGKKWELVSNISAANYTFWKNENYGMAYGEKGLVFTTRNGGVTWTPQKLTDSTIQRFRTSNFAYAGNNGNCFISYPDANFIDKKNIMISNDSGETFKQMYDDSLNNYLSASIAGYLPKEDGSLFLYLTYDSQKYQLSKLIILDSNFKFVKSRKILDSSIILSNTIRKVNNNFEGFAVHFYGNDRLILDSCELFVIKSADGENWVSENISRIYGNVRSILKFNDYDYLMTVSKIDAVIIDTVTHFGRVFYNYYVLYYNLNTSMYDTLLKSHHNSLYKFINYNGIIYNGGQRSIFSIDSSKLLNNSWDSINIKPYQSFGVIYQFGNVLYGSGTYGTKVNILKFTLPQKVDEVQEQTELRSNVFAYPPYPIPADNRIKCKIYWDTRFDINESKFVVYDVNGNLYDTEGKITINQQQSYSGEIVWDCTGIPNGIYLISFTHGDVTKIISVVIQR